MSKAIPKGLQREHVLSALRDLDAGTEHPFGEPTKYELVHDGIRYPPKGVVGIAFKHLTGTLLPPDEFSGGEGAGQANHELRRLGFVVDRIPVSWMLLAHGDARLYSGNTGYQDDISSVYRYDSFVANHKQLTVGDKVVLASPQGAAGFAQIERIEAATGEKELFRCPECLSTQVKRRKRKKPDYRCGHAGCGHEFDRNQGISEHAPCTMFEAHFQGTFSAASGPIPMPELRSACPGYTGQLSIQRIDFEAIRSRIEEQAPDALWLLDNDATATQHEDGTYTSQLGEEATRADEEGYFEPATLEDERERKLREIVQRRGQPEFRKKLLFAYRGRCAITGCDVASALEAAHISPYRGPDSNHVTNGVLLRADIHTLFDLDLIRIDPDSLVVVLAEKLRESSYKEIGGRKVTTPDEAKLAPNREVLQQRWDRFKAK